LRLHFAKKQLTFDHSIPPTSVVLLLAYPKDNTETLSFKFLLNSFFTEPVPEYLYDLLKTLISQAFVLP
jgi:hypothetical protein